MRRILPALLGLAGLFSFFVAQSGAQTAKPEPSCAGIAATDPNNDGVSDPIGLGVGGGPGAANLEILRFWFDRQNGKTTANVEVKNLNKAIENGDEISWYVTWTSADGDKFVDATSDGDAVTYEYGDYDADQGLYSPAGDTTGQFITGPNGVVSVVIPSGGGGAVGNKLTDPYATTTENTNAVAVGLLNTADRAPNEGSGKSWTIADCPPTGSASPGPTGATGPTGPAVIGPTGPSGGPPSGGGPSQVVQPGKLNVKAKSALGSAKKAAKKKKAFANLTGQATKITATLYKGSFAKPKIYGKGKLARLSGKAKLKLKLSKKVKKGKYALTLIGTNPDGTRAEKSFKVKFKK
jgi:hypothetical protein